MINTIFGNIYKKTNGNPRVERIWLLSKIDFKRRYNEGSFGLIWALVNPLIRMGIYYFAFSVILTSTIENYALYLVSGLILWMFFAQSTKQSMTLFRRNNYLMENIQFNKFDMFIASLLSAFYSFAFSFVAYIVLFYAVGLSFNHYILFFPLWIAVLMIITLGINYILATVRIFFSDINQLWDLIILAGFWTSPILFRGEAISEKAPFLMYINPVSGIIINVRKCILTGEPPDWSMGLYSILYGLVLLLIGSFLFKTYSHKALERI